MSIGLRTMIAQHPARQIARLLDALDISFEIRETQ
jgi:hypothetical protein